MQDRIKHEEHLNPRGNYLEMLNISFFGSSITNYNFIDRQQALSRYLDVRDLLFIDKYNRLIFQACHNYLNITPTEGTTSIFATNYLLQHLKTYTVETIKNNPEQYAEKEAETILNNKLLEIEEVIINLNNSNSITFYDIEQATQELTDSYLYHQQKKLEERYLNLNQNLNRNLPLYMETLNTAVKIANKHKEKTLKLNNVYDQIIMDHQLRPDNYLFKLAPLTFSGEINGEGVIPPSTYCIVGALPGHGKTAFLLQNIVQALINYEEREDKPTIVFYSAELTLERVAMLLAKTFLYRYNYTSLGGTQDHYKIFLGDLNKEQQDRLMEHCLFCFRDYLVASGWNDYLYIKDCQEIQNVEELASFCKQLQTNGKKPEFLFIDYLQTISVSDSETNQNAYARNNKVTNTIRELTKTYKLRTIAAAQINKNPIYSETNMPSEDSIKATTNYTQDADLIITLFKYKPPAGADNTTATGPTNVIFASLAKNRLGSPNINPAKFYIHKGNGVFPHDCIKNLLPIKYKLTLQQRLEELRQTHNIEQ